MKASKKVLVDNLGRVVGLVAPRTGKIGNNIEYGGVRDGVLDVQGIARIERKNIDDYEIEHLRVYDGNTGRRINSSAASALGSIRTDKKSASSRENGKKGGRPTQKWTKARIKRALDVIDTRVKFHSTSTEVSQIQDDASFLSVYRKTDIPVNTIDEFIEYTEMSRTKEIDFLFNALNKK